MIDWFDFHFWWLYFTLNLCCQCRSSLDLMWDIASVEKSVAWGRFKRSFRVFQEFIKKFKLFLRVFYGSLRDPGAGFSGPPRDSYIHDGLPVVFDGDSWHFKEISTSKLQWNCPFCELKRSLRDVPTMGIREYSQEIPVILERLPVVFDEDFEEKIGPFMDLESSFIVLEKLKKL